jgi:hypothetical protein
LAATIGMAELTVANAPEVVKRLWVAMRGIGGSVPKQPRLSACSESEAWSERLRGNCRRAHELHQAIDAVAEWCECRGASIAARAVAAKREGQPTEQAEHERPLPEPVKYCHGWPEILQALKLKNNDDQRRVVRRLNERRDGPITFGSTGERPWVVAHDLLAWWNSLGQQVEEAEKQRANASESTSGQYNYGRNGTVVPEIKGHVKKKRGESAR